MARNLERTERILSLRKERGLSVTQIKEILDQEGMNTGIATIARTIRDAGYPRLFRRSASVRAAAVSEPVKLVSDRKALDLSPRRISTQFGGLFLFIHDLARTNLDNILTQGGVSGSDKVPAGCAIRSLLALKLWGVGRPFSLMPKVLDEGPALFAGLNVIPQVSTLSEVSSKLDPGSLPPFIVRRSSADLGGGRSFDMDFRSIPSHGSKSEQPVDSALARRQNANRAILARDVDSRVLAYASADFRKEDRSQEILRFVQVWKQRTGGHPTELAFDSRLTTFADLAVLDGLGITFLTLRRRTTNLLASILAHRPHQWRTVRLANVANRFKVNRVLDQMVTLKDYPSEVRQVAFINPADEQPTILLTNNMTARAAKIITRHLQRTINKGVIANAIEFFHEDALSSVVPMSTELDLQLSIMGSKLYRLLAHRIGFGFERSETKILFRDLVRTKATVDITKEEIIVRFGRGISNAALLAGAYDTSRARIPWLKNKPLTFAFA